MAYSLSYIKPLTKKGFIKNASTFLSFFLFKIAFPFFSLLSPIFVNDFQCRLKRYHAIPRYFFLLLVRRDGIRRKG